MTDSERSNLVIVRAGDSSLHPAWLPASGVRDWDLLVSYYDSDPDRFRLPDVMRLDGKGPKWIELHNLLVAQLDMLQRYDYIWLADDDIDCRAQDIDALFAVMKRHNLKLAQPSLSPKGYFTWCITLRNPLTRLRWTNFVENMVPCFHRNVLIECLPMMEGRIAGWGLEWTWTKAAGSDPRQIAIIDEIAVIHTRPAGSGGSLYRFFDGQEFNVEHEREDILRTSGVSSEVTRITGFVTRGGLRMRANSKFARLLLRASYWLTIVTAYVTRNPHRWNIHKRLKQHLANPADLADHQ